MEYEATLSYRGINFGLMEGKDILLIVKTGSGGNIYSNKYLKLSERIKLMYNATVIVSDNPLNVSSEENLALTLEIAKNYQKEHSINLVYYFGVSKSGQYAAMFAFIYEQRNGVY